MEEKRSMIEEAEAFVRQEFETRMPKVYAYHNLAHTLDTAAVALEIGSKLELAESDLEVLHLAGLFHDLGYIEVYQGHEEVSARMAQEFLEAREADATLIEQVKGCIAATKVPQNPQNNLEEILCDADLSSLAKDGFKERSECLRSEWMQFLDMKADELEWWEMSAQFIENHTYHTAYAREHFDAGKAANVSMLKEKIESMKASQPEISENPEESGETTEAAAPKEKSAKKKKKKKKPVSQPSEFDGLTEVEIAKAIKKQFKEKTPERGIETMFRTTSRNHIQLSAIADNKANIMLSINAIIISIIVSSLVPRLTDEPQLLIPTSILLMVCVVSVIFATLSTIPKVTQGTFSKKDIEEKRANLLFFGNFHSMDLDVFQAGMNEMMGDRDFLYGAMMRDLYFLGKVLDRKYRFLRICYRVFMTGLVISVLAFAAAFLLR